MQHRKRAFTLLEIMIVIAIVGIILALAVPAFLRSRSRTQLTACQKQQTTIDGAVQQYILLENKPDLKSCPELHGSGWRNILLGGQNLLRMEPRCPSGGIYTVLPAEDPAYGSGVVCSYPTHPYPKEG